MANVQLVRLDASVEEALANHPEYIEALVHDDWARVAALVHRLVGRTLVPKPASVDELQWGGYFVVDQRTREVVGSCAYKSPPKEDGTVEIAYFSLIRWQLAAPGSVTEFHRQQLKRKMNYELRSPNNLFILRPAPA